MALVRAGDLRADVVATRDDTEADPSLGIVD